MESGSQSPLRLVYIVGTYPTITTTFIDREIAVLRDLGVEIDVISIRSPDPDLLAQPEYRAIAADTTSLLPTTPARVVRAHLYFLLRRPGRYLSTCGYLLTRRHPSLRAWLKTLLHFGEAALAADCARRSAPQHIHAHFLDRAATLALVVARLLGCSYSITAHANDIYVNPVLLGPKMANAAFVVTVSEYNRAHLLQAVPEADGGNLAVLHPWVDTSSFVPSSGRRPGSTRRVLSVGRLVEKKGHQYLIEACALLRDRGVEVECTVVGDGPLFADLQSKIRALSLGDIVTLEGALPQSEVRRLAAESDLFVLACVVAADGDRDGIPVALAEAMAVGLPVVSTDVVGVSELVQSGTGVLAEPGDASSLADAIESVLNGDMEMMGIAGRDVVVAQFDLRAGVARLLELFQETQRSTAEGARS